MDKNKYLEDLHDIRDMMDRSSRFISLSGISGIIAGIAALLGAYFAYETIYAEQDYLNYRRVCMTFDIVLQLFSVAAVVLFVSIFSGIYFTHKKAKKNQQKLWDSQSKRLLINLMIPLVVGGLVCLIFILRGFIGIIAPLSLIFYGLALVNASKYTLTDIRSLGLLEITVGLIGCYFIGYGLLLWAIGFGVFHIVYGIVMYKKYDA